VLELDAHQQEVDLAHHHILQGGGDGEGREVEGKGMRVEKG
jgi:hypothetical protein